MHLQKLLSWLLVLVFISAFLVGCETPGGLTATEFIPQDANLIANIQISEILNDQDLRDAYDEAEKEAGQPQTFEEALDELADEVGIDLRDFSEVVIFADIATIAQTGYLGIIVEGSFNKTQFINSIEQQAGQELTTTSYKGYTLYTDAGEEAGITFLTSRVLLLGTMEAVRDAIDVSKGDQEQLSGIVVDTYNQLGDALIKVAFELPEEATDALTEELVPGGIPISLDPFADIDIVGFALNKEGEAITIQITPHFLSTDSAQDARDTLSGAISLLRLTLEIPEIDQLLGKVEVSVTDSWVTIALEITVSEIEWLIEMFQASTTTATR